MKSFLPLLCILAFVLTLAPVRHVPIHAATGAINSHKVEDERGIIALDQSLRELNNPYTVVSIGARPGDEDDGTLAYLRKKLGARVILLFATQGENEDNLRFLPAPQLAQVHTGEAIEAARVLGADLMFLKLPDPGYCKSADEAFAVWKHDEALRQLIVAIRSLRPDVVLTPHDPKVGEGTAQAVARLTQEAFVGAANSKMAPEAGSEAWETQHLFRRAAGDGDVSINLAQHDRIRGKSYAQLGLEAHHQFVSRLASSDRLTPQVERVSYKLIASSTDEKLNRDSDLLDGLVVPEKVSKAIVPPRVGDQNIVDGIGGGDRLIDALLEKLIEKRAEGTIADLRERYGSQFARMVRFTASLERALTLALGLSIDASISDRILVPGQKVIAKIAIQNGGRRSFPVVMRAPEQLAPNPASPAFRESEVTGLGVAGSVSYEFEYEVPESLNNKSAADRESPFEYYAVGSSLPGAQPSEAFGSQLILSAEIGLGQTSIQMAAIVRYDVANKVEISTVAFAALKDWSSTRTIHFPVRVRNRTPGPLAGALWVVQLALTQDEYDPIHLAFNAEDQEITVELNLRLPVLKPPLASDVLIEFRREKPAPPDPLGTAKVEVKAMNFEVAEGLRVGYIRAQSDWLPLALDQLGVSREEIPVNEISSITHGSDASQSRPDCKSLSSFDAIIVDQDAYFAHSDLILQNRCLLRYARQGGTLIVLAQRPDDFNLLLSGIQFAPYHLELSLNRQTYENGRVKLLDEQQPLASKPNQLTSKDFEGWMIERALNVPKSWADEFSPIVETSDPGEDANRGSLLLAKYGDGSYLFSSLALPRQLVAGNAGAYRLFANMVSLSRTLKQVAKPQ